MQSQTNEKIMAKEMDEERDALTDVDKK